MRHYETNQSKRKKQQKTNDSGNFSENKSEQKRKRCLRLRAKIFTKPNELNLRTDFI